MIHGPSAYAIGHERALNVWKVLQYTPVAPPGHSSLPFPSVAHSRSTQILRFFIQSSVRQPKFTIAVALLALVALASTLTYVGSLVVGVVADLLGTGRVLAGLLLGILFARFPWLSNGKLRTVGLLPKIVRRPILMSLLALCLWSFVAKGEYVPVMFIGFAAAFLLAFPWLRRAMVGQLVSTLFKSATDQTRPKSTDDRVIDVEFREKKD